MSWKLAGIWSVGDIVWPGIDSYPQPRRERTAILLGRDGGKASRLVIDTKAAQEHRWWQRLAVGVSDRWQKVPLSVATIRRGMILVLLMSINCITIADQDATLSSSFRRNAIVVNATFRSWLQISSNLSKKNEPTLAKCQWWSESKQQPQHNNMQLLTNLRLPTYIQALSNQLLFPILHRWCWSTLQTQPVAEDSAHGSMCTGE